MTIKEREDIKEAARLVALAWDHVVQPNFSRAYFMGHVLSAKELLDNLLQAEPRKAARKTDGNP